MDKNFQIEVLKLHVQEVIELQKSGVTSVVSWGQAAVRGAFLLNGSAAAAVIAKQDPITPVGAIVLQYCAWGAMLAVLCAGACYVSQNFYYRAAAKNLKADLEHAFAGKPKIILSPLVGHIFMYLAIGSFLVSLWIFCCALQNIIELLGR